MTVPLARAARAGRASCPGAVAAVAPGARPILFGHLGEGNLHVNVLDAGEPAEQVTEAVLRPVAELGGSISTEHGVGRAKPAGCTCPAPTAEIAAMRAVKNALDPQGLLNPGVLFA